MPPGHVAHVSHEEPLGLNTLKATLTEYSCRSAGSHGHTSVPGRMICCTSHTGHGRAVQRHGACLLYTSDAADDM
eukprot:5047860-Alexandrium_andersonii.AAC.1